MLIPALNPLLPATLYLYVSYSQGHPFALMEPVISANDYTLPLQSRPCYKAAVTVGDGKGLSKQTMAILTLAVSAASDLK